MRHMSAALKLNPETDKLSRKTPLGEKRSKPRLAWKNPKLSAEPHKEKSKVRLDASYGRVLYNYFRDYDPGIGQYVQSDPIGLASGPSTYSYVRSNPLTNTDRLGLLNLVGGIGGSGVVVLGADFSGGIALNIDSADVLSNVAQFGSAGLAVGLNISADVFGGVIIGGLENVQGNTENINLVPL